MVKRLGREEGGESDLVNNARHLLKDGISDNLGNDLGVHVGRAAFEGLKSAWDLRSLMCG